MKVLLNVATSSNVDDPGVLDPLIRTEGWQTLMTFTREMAREYSYVVSTLVRLTDRFCRRAAARPDTSAPSAPSHTAMNEDIPQEIYDQIAREEAGYGSGGGGGGSSAAGNVRICPHCTFENTHGGNDCEICGLPL